jgi:small subunit ribosomal protein S4
MVAALQNVEEYNQKSKKKMARYTGPKSKIARKFSEPIFGSDKAYERKPYPPGQHGANKNRKKTSEYGTQLKEKQKAKYTYGVLERQFANLFDRAHRSKGITGEVLLQLLESRLDNVVYRLGIAPSRAAARQLVSHCHIVVNGELVNIPSYQIKSGMSVGVRERSKALEVITNSVGRQSRYSWLEWDAASMTGKFLNVPERSEIPENIREQLIVELYSK